MRDGENLPITFTLCAILTISNYVISAKDEIQIILKTGVEQICNLLPRNLKNCATAGSRHLYPDISLHNDAESMKLTGAEQICNLLPRNLKNCATALSSLFL